MAWEILFLKNGTQNGEASHRTFYKKSKFSLSLHQQFEMLYSLFLLYVEEEIYQIILKIRCWPLALTSFEAFLENKKRFLTSLHYALLTDQTSLLDCLYFLLGDMYTCFFLRKCASITPKP